MARTGDEVVDHLSSLTGRKAAEIGGAAYQRVLAEHTYAHRAAQIDALLGVSQTEPVGVTP